MKDFFWGVLVGGFLVFCGQADATDLLTKGSKVVEAYSSYWDGFYLGVNGGYGTGRIDASTFSSDSASGFLGGIQAGANKQLGNIVIGLVTDLDIGGVEKSGNKLMARYYAGEVGFSRYACLACLRYWRCCLRWHQSRNYPGC